MTRITTLDGIKKGDKLLELETVQGLNGNLVGAFLYPLTVVKVTKAKVHVNNDYFNCGYALRKDGDFENRDFYCGKKTEFFKPDDSETLQQAQLVLQV